MGVIKGSLGPLSSPDYHFENRLSSSECPPQIPLSATQFFFVHVKKYFFKFLANYKEKIHKRRNKKAKKHEIKTANFTHNETNKN